MFSYAVLGRWVVPNIKDINFWEQFTTQFGNQSFTILLFRISKISTFESNSQLFVVGFVEIFCCSEYQRYQLLRAIHNSYTLWQTLHAVVPNIKDINFWEQFTTWYSTINKSLSLFRISKISTFESNSQQSWTFSGGTYSCSEYQRYQLLRAIHNCQVVSLHLSSVVPNIKDINFWEQFTTPHKKRYTLFRLFRISKISTFESNSQPPGAFSKRSDCCSEYQRYQLLRAIHNTQEDLI